MGIALDLRLWFEKSVWGKHQVWEIFTSKQTWIVYSKTTFCLRCLRCISICKVICGKTTLPLQLQRFLPVFSAASDHPATHHAVVVRLAVRTLGHQASPSSPSASWSDGPSGRNSAKIKTSIFGDWFWYQLVICLCESFWHILDMKNVWQLEKQKLLTSLASSWVREGSPSALNEGLHCKSNGSFS